VFIERTLEKEEGIDFTDW